VGRRTGKGVVEQQIPFVRKKGPKGKKQKTPSSLPFVRRARAFASRDTSARVPFFVLRMYLI
jgi:hypothetical protein